MNNVENFSRVLLPKSLDRPQSESDKPRSSIYFLARTNNNESSVRQHDWLFT